MEQLLVSYILMQSYNLLSYFLHEIRKTHLSLIFPSKITSLHILEEQKYKNTISAYLKSQKQNISIALSQIQMVQSRMFHCKHIRTSEILLPTFYPTNPSWDPDSISFDYFSSYLCCGSTLSLNEMLFSFFFMLAIKHYYSHHPLKNP